MCNVFIAPRKKEGIGLIIIEAISKGMFIVGYNDSTMNEYITDKKIGFLINKNEQLIDHNDVINNLNCRMQFAKKGYFKWIQQKSVIINFFLNHLKKKKRNLFIEILFFLDLIKFFIKKIY